jgi:hypothetical protein
MAVRPSPASTEKVSVHSAVTGLPARDRPVGTVTARKSARSRSHVADVRPRIRRAFRRGCRPPAPRLARRAAGGATVTVPISECRRRHEGTGGAFPFVCTASFPRTFGVREFTLEARIAGNAPGLGGRIHDPDTLGRIGSRTLAALGLPESPSPHPSGCDPDEACACGLDQARRLCVGDTPSPSAHPIRPLSSLVPRRGPAIPSC